MFKVRSTQKYFLSIAATDTTGEAGITKDCKIANQFGFNTLGAVTAITIQDDNGVKNIYPLDGSILEEQLDICSTFDVNCLKIGVLGNKKNALIVAESLSKFPQAIKVWDPVFSPTSGESFVMDSDIGDILWALLPEIDILTPNFSELAKILNIIDPKHDNWQRSAHDMAKKYDVALFVSGGHSDTEDILIREFLIDKERIICLSKMRTPLRYQHGTGCTLSTTLACYMTLATDIVKACRKSTELVDLLYT
ncbi:MAG: bifunctional hydroxymethylpyrimidine kinase/phosphomethylpyrimidine kinase [Candidatus Cloacimonetes bacterium]|nr:bifunctional hydroxymethylpyrimidine kinase/phosphomethylpyrimidine kinase [Candidatus Cloacimonadota bacterium]